MKENTNFLPGISSKLMGRVARRQLEAFRHMRLAIRGGQISDIGLLFEQILPSEEIAELQQDIRKRIFPEVVTFWAWITQILGCNKSCASAVGVVQSWYQTADLPPPTFDTSSFCRARQRLSERFLSGVLKRVHQYCENRIRPEDLWRGHRVKLVDGTSFKLMDTQANQVAFPQPKAQKPGCGFPVMGVVGLFDLSTGAMDDYVTSEFTQHDARGLYPLRSSLNPGDLLLADRAFCSYAAIAQHESEGVASIMRLHQKREGKLDWRRGKRLDKHSRLVTWRKPAQRPKSGISTAEWESLPAEISIRLVRFRHKGRDKKMKTVYLATTLRDRVEYPSEEIAKIYAQRWQIEVRFRDIKTTMGLEMLRVKSPDMALKTLKMLRIGYNLVKALQKEAIRGSETAFDALGFKGTLDVIDEWRSAFCGLQNRPRLLMKQWKNLEARIRERELTIRPGRREPRAVKQRPKPYSLLTKPRHEFIEIMHREHYRALA